MLQALKNSNSLRAILDQCDSLITGILQSANIREARIALESFSSGGKRLRPALMLLSSTVAAGKTIEATDPPLVDLASAIELIHLATLFHDDVIDDVETRRNSMSAKAKYGNHASVLAGDFALTEALLLVQRSKMMHTMPEFLRTMQVLVRGESRETGHKFDFDMSDAVYYEIISEKSASLFSLSCKIGALAQYSEFSDTLGHFGWNLGMAFQMIDDLDDMLDLPNSSEDCDLRNGYLSLPIILALGSLEDGHKEGLVEIIQSGQFTRDNEKRIVSLCHEMGAIQRTRTEIHEYLDNAAQILDRFERSEAIDFLVMILKDLKAYADSQEVGFVEFAQSGS